MCKKILLKKKILLLVGIFFVGFATFAQTGVPYNVVMNIYDDPKTKMAFNWFTGAGITGGKVEIMLGANIVKTVSAACTQYFGYTENKALVTGLAPNTTYSFRVGKDNAWSSIGTFTTAKSNKDPFSFIYVTDSQVGDTAILRTNAKAAFTNCKDVNFWLHCGDLMWESLNGTNTHADQMKQFFAAQQNYFYHYPFAPILGNHDAPGNDTIFKGHFNLNSTSFDSQGSTYTYIYGDAQFFAINSEQHDKSSPNPVYDAAYLNALSNWMRAEVAAHPDITWRIVYFHRPVYSGASDEQNVPWCVAQWFNTLDPLFDELKIDIALQGHSHVYDVIGPVFNQYPVLGSVSNVVQGNPIDTVNISGKSGGVFNVSEGTQYFTNGTFGTHWDLYPFPLTSMPGSCFSNNSNCPDCPNIPHYASLITGRLGQTQKSTYSHVAVSSDTITITTYEIINRNSQLLDEIKLTKYCEPNTQRTITYNTSQTFTNVTKIIGEELRITNNATVTFNNSTLRFYKDAKVIIEPGSKLIINGGILTASCDNKMWQGIVVLGNSDYPQTGTQQGTVELKNGATIEHALCAIAVHDKATNGFVVNISGGIVKANNAFFYNNLQSLRMKIITQVEPL